MTSPTIRAIKTTYRGVLFMSTLEADWAKTLDSLGIRWMYEPEGLRLPDGQNYRCDFYLPAVATWFEVKGPHDQRLDKPGVLADAQVHAPGCSEGSPQQHFERPDGLPPARCACGFGPLFPFRLVVVGRPAVAGRVTFEASHATVPAMREARLVVLACRVCGQRSFADAAGLPVCRRCRQLSTGSQTFRTGTLKFQRVEPPRGGRPRRRKAA